VYEPREPGYIEAEIAVEQHDWQGALDGRWSRPGVQSLGGYARARTYLTRDELLAERGGQRALDAWQAGDDTLFQEGEDRRHIELAEASVRTRAAEGCTVAESIIDEDSMRQQPTSSRTRTSAGRRAAAGIG
jgi:hypothetical protein